MVSHALATLATRRRFASAILVLTLLSGAAVAAEDAAAPPVAVAARLVEDGETAKLSFDLSGPVEASAHAMADPDRIVVSDRPFIINMLVWAAIAAAVVYWHWPPGLS